MHDETYKALNELVQMCFQQNALADNIFYNLADKYLLVAGDIWHHSYAHAWGGVADMITDEMLKLNARPIRIGLVDETDKYGSVGTMMAVNLVAMEKIFKKCKEIVEIADMMDDVDIRIFGENLLNGTLLPFLKQSHEWVNAAKTLSEYQFNIHFDDYTHFISIVGGAHDGD